MPILNYTPVQLGLVGNQPNLALLETNDTLAQVLTAGYLNALVHQRGGVLNTLEMMLVSTKLTPSDPNSMTQFLSVSYTAPNWSLVPTSAPGDVTLPTIANHIAAFTNTTGGLSEDPATAISGGNIQAGLSGTAGYFRSFPASAAKGSLELVAAASSGDTITQITNASQAAARTYTIPDGGQAASSFLLTDNATTQTIATGSLALTVGTLTLGSSNHASSLTIYPPTAANGFMEILPIAAGGAFNTIISNSAMGQTSTISIPDPGVATSTFIIADKGASGTQTIATGNLALSVGTLTLGSSGHASSLTLFPGTAANGTLLIVPVNAGGAFNTTISNGTMGQTTVFTLPDPGAATAKVVVAAAATVSGNLIKATGVAGQVADAGFAVLAKTTSSYAGGGTSNAFTATGLATTSIVTASILNSTNAVSITKVVPTANVLTVSFSADPGASTTVSYIAITPAV